MMRKFLTLDGDVLEESEWAVNPLDSCFYCNAPLWITANDRFKTCYDSLDGNHDWITLVKPL